MWRLSSSDLPFATRGDCFSAYTCLLDSLHGTRYQTLSKDDQDRFRQRKLMMMMMMMMVMVIID